MTYPANTSAAKLNTTNTQIASISQFKRSPLVEPELVAEPASEMSPDVRTRALPKICVFEVMTMGRGLALFN
jgi:hypothetical protein